MVKRTLKRVQADEVTHKVVSVHNGEVIARCGAKARKPKAGFGNFVAFRETCQDCIAETQAIKDRFFLG